LRQVKLLAARGEVRISAHGYDELADDVIFVLDVLEGLPAAAVVEDYPEAVRGPSVLVLQKDGDGKPIHVLWGLPEGSTSPAVVIYGLSSRSIAVISRFDDESKAMNRTTTKLVREDKYAAEVTVELIEEDGGWSPYLSVEEATKLDAVRKALRAGDLVTAGKHGRVFELLPIPA
jgi:hypothetical protein